MTPELGQQIGGALQRLNEIKAIDKPTDDQKKEAEGLVSWLSEQLITHASQLVGCYFVATFEYTPLVNALGGVFSRHMEVFQQKMRAIAKASKKEKSNIIVPPAFKR